MTNQNYIQFFDSAAYLKTNIKESYKKNEHEYGYMDLYKYPIDGYAPIVLYKTWENEHTHTKMISNKLYQICSHKEYVHIHRSPSTKIELINLWDYTKIHLIINNKLCKYKLQSLFTLYNINGNIIQ